jgi:RimJ/RimL family protein N-acetyltransferase
MDLHLERIAFRSVVGVTGAAVATGTGRERNQQINLGEEFDEIAGPNRACFHEIPMGIPRITSAHEYVHHIMNMDLSIFERQIPFCREGPRQIRWALFDHRNGDFVGCGGLRPWVYSPSEADFEVGFHLVRRCWGQGFGTEAALGALEYAWEKLQLSKVYAGHHPDNHASENILKKLDSSSSKMSFTSPPA